MRKNHTWIWIVSIVAGVAALTAALTSFFVLKEKKRRDDEELEAYLEDSIQ